MNIIIIILTFIMGVIVCFLSAMIFGDMAFTGIAIIYLAAVIAGTTSSRYGIRK